MNWNADYVLTVHSDQKAADLNGWVTVVNQSGASFRNALLQLVAGELNRVAQPRSTMQFAMEAKAMAAPAPQFQQEAISEYHLYTLQRPTNIQENETSRSAC